MINNNHLLQRNKIHTLQDIYTTDPIEQSTDKLTNQTSFALHFQNAYNRAQFIEVGQINDIKCKYCKAYYFPPLQSKQNTSVFNVSQTKNRINIIDETTKTFTCELCESINETKTNLTTIFPQFPLVSEQQASNKYKGNIQSVMVTQSPNNLKTNNLSQVLNQVIFIFCIDVDILPQSIQISTLTYLKTVIKECFTRYLEKIQENTEENNGFPCEKQNYSLLIALNINDQLFIGDLNTMSTICIDSLLKQKLLSSIPAQNTQQIHEKESQRKQSLIQLLKKCSLKLNHYESLEKVEQYFDLLIEQQQQSVSKPKFSVQCSTNFNKLMQMLAFDKSPNSYVVSWISRTPLLNYEPNRVKRSNIYSVLYLFHQDPNKIQPQNSTKSSFVPDSKFQQSNIRNQLIIIQDNNQVHFIETNDQDNHQFYYKLYELFSIIDCPKLFRPRWSIKSDSKYPPMLTNQFPYFFIRDYSMLYFIVSSLLDKGGHSKFQVSVVFENWKRQQKIWLINWTKDSQKQKAQLKANYHKQFQSSLLVYKLPEIYNYLHILTKFAQRMCIRGKDDLPTNSVKKSSLFASNSVTSQHFCVIFESIINQGVFRASNIEIGIEYVQRIYEYCDAMKNIRYEVLSFFSCCQYKMRRAMMKLFPLVIRPYSINDEECLIYWSSGYTLLNEDEQYMSEEQQSWQEGAITALNENYQKKYVTKRYYYQGQIDAKQMLNDFRKESLDSAVAKFYFEKSFKSQTPSHPQVQESKSPHFKSYYSESKPIVRSSSNTLPSHSSLPHTIPLILYHQQ